MPETWLGAVQTAGLKKRKFVGRWNLTNSIRSEITRFDHPPKNTQRAGT